MSSSEAAPSNELRGYWEDQMAKRLKREPSQARRAIILADALDECAAIYRQGPFPVIVHPSDEAKADAVRKVAQLARTVAKELRALSGMNQATPDGDKGAG